MSCNYAEGLSSYDNKGILGTPEIFDSKDAVEEKCKELVGYLETSKHVVVHTGAGISTSAGIPDFRGPKGVWTLEKKGEKPAADISFNDAVPTRTHMALRALLDAGYVHYIVSQNIDGLHMKSGMKREHISELHGNMFVEQCNKCKKLFVRATAAETVGQKPCGGACRVGAGSRQERACRGGVLIDNVLDWEADLPERDLDLAFMHATIADLNITLGTTLQIVPSGNLPLKNKKHGGKLVICNLQPTKHDKKADLIIHTYVDDILTKVCKRLGVEIPDYNPADDPTKTSNSGTSSDWTISAQAVKSLEKEYNAQQKEAAQKRKLSKGQFTFFTQNPSKELAAKKTKIKSEEDD